MLITRLRWKDIFGKGGSCLHSSGPISGVFCSHFQLFVFYCQKMRSRKLKMIEYLFATWPLNSSVTVISVVSYKKLRGVIFIDSNYHTMTRICWNNVTSGQSIIRSISLPTEDFLWHFLISFFLAEF